MKPHDLTYRIDGDRVAFTAHNRYGRTTLRQLGAVTIAELPRLLKALKRVGIRVEKASA